MLTVVVLKLKKGLHLVHFRIALNKKKMEEAIFPPSPSWSLPNILSSREDGSVSYGSKNNIVILKALPNNNFKTLIIHNAHNSKITSVVFLPLHCEEPVCNTIASSSDDGFVKLWKIDTQSLFQCHKSHWNQNEENSKIICLDRSFANIYHIVSVAENDTLILWEILSNTTKKFKFQNMKATVVSCCPYNEKIVAVGRKTGQIYIINLSGDGEIVYKLRGHDNKIHSLAWCPLPYNIFEDDVYEEFLLASACQDKEIFIWRAGSNGKTQLKFQIPTNSLLKKNGNQYHKLGSSFNFISLFWAEPYRIYFSSNFGEMLYFDVKSYLLNKSSKDDVSFQKSNKHLSDSIKLGHSFHSKGLFAISGIIIKANIIIYNSNKINQNLKFEINSNKCNTIEILEKEKSCKWEVILPDTTSMIWTAAQDRKIIACKPNGTDFKIIRNFHTMNGIVYCAVISPLDPNKIAIGVGDGVIRLWNLTDPNGEIQMYWQKIKDRVMSLAWHPVKDGILAYGTSEGRVGLIDLNSNKLPCVFHHCVPQSIYNLSWGPKFPPSDGLTENSDFCLYVVCDSKISVYNPSKLNAEQIHLNKALQFPCKKQTDVSWKHDYSVMAIGNEDGSICLVEPKKFSIVYTLLAYKKLIQSIAWHPTSTSFDSGLSPYHGYFTSGSTDNLNEIRVFNYIKNETKVVVEQVTTLKGHYGHIQSVSWCPHASAQLASSSSDGSVQIWDVLTESPLVNFKATGLPMFSIWSPICSDIILTGCRDDVLAVWKVSKLTRTLPSQPIKIKKNKKDKIFATTIQNEASPASSNCNINIVVDNQHIEKDKLNEISSDLIAEPKSLGFNSKEPKMFSKSWKKNESEELNAFYLLLKKKQTSNNDEYCYSLSMLCDEECYKKLIKAEEDSCKKSNNWNEYYQLSLWKGNIKEVLEEKIRSGQLNDFLVSLAPMISPRVWQEACLSYSKTLAEKNLFRKAATYLLVCHKVYEAIKLLTDANLFLEALCIARNRLPMCDPVIKNIVSDYATWLSRNGSCLKACECYLFLDNYLEIAKICGKKSQPEFLSFAALAAQKCGASDLESLEATNAILNCFGSNNLDLAKRICDDHCDLKHLRLLYNMYCTLIQLDSNNLVLEKDIISYVNELTQVENIVFPDTLQQKYSKYTFYKNKQKMLIAITLELSFACCSKVHSDILSHLIKALSASYRYINTLENENHPLYKLCVWLAPSGFLVKNTYFSLTEKHLLPKVKSLRAFLCAGIVRNLNDKPETDNSLQYIILLKEIINDLLDKDSYKYFKNLIEIEVFEKRLLTNRNNLARSKLSKNKVDPNYNTDCSHFENGIIDNKSEIDKTNENNLLENKFLETLKLKEENEQRIEDLTESVNESIANTNIENGENILDNEHCLHLPTDLDLKKKILQDMEVLNKIKTEVENFEISRVNSPNPVPVYAMLKSILKKLSQYELANAFFNNLEEIWNELQ